MARPARKSAAPIAASEPTETPVELPASIVVTSLFAFWADDGAFLQWQPGARVTDPEEIALLLVRAPHAIEV